MALIHAYRPARRRPSSSRGRVPLAGMGRLSLPGLVALSLAGPGRANDADEWQYVVVRGDNPWSLTGKYLDGVRYWPQLQRLNGITEPTRIPPGTRLRIPTAWLRVRPASAEVVAVTGAPRLVREGAESPLAAGMRLKGGDRIEAPEGAGATLELGDRSRVVLRSDSVLTIDRLQRFDNTDRYRTGIRLERGRIENIVVPRPPGPDRFESITPSAVTAVRGTSYRVSAGPDETRAEVLEGRVAVTTPVAGIEVPQGFGTRARRDAAPLAPRSLLETPDTADVPRLFERVPIVFPAPPLAGADRMRLQIAGPSGFDTPLFDGVSPPALVRGPDLADGEYRARLRGIDAEGLEGRDAAFAFVLNARPEPPVLVAPPPDGRIAEAGAQLQWAERAGVDRYRVQVARDAAFADLVTDTETSAAVLTLPEPLAPGRYRWRIAAIAPAEGAGPFSDVQTFRRPLSGPALEAPAVSDALLVLRWRAGAPGQSYQVQFAASDDFQEPLADVRTETPQLEVPRPEGGDYFVRVRTIDVDGLEGFYGPAERIAVPSRPIPWWLILLPLIPILLL